MGVWPLQDPKSQLSDMVQLARREGPQTISEHGIDRAVLLSIEDYRALSGAVPDFAKYLLAGPKADDLVIARDKDAGRTVEL
jgi:prevent-host-death family protein